jgi:hypothetical protein
VNIVRVLNINQAKAKELGSKAGAVAGEATYVGVVSTWQLLKAGGNIVAAAAKAAAKHATNKKV